MIFLPQCDIAIDVKGRYIIAIDVLFMQVNCRYCDVLLFHYMLSSYFRAKVIFYITFRFFIHHIFDCYITYDTDVG